MENIQTNIENQKLKDYFCGELLDGQIQLASTRGYPSNPKHLQEDAIGSIAKNNSCFFNIVADGLGAYKKSNIASRTVVEEMIKWFQETAENQINNTKEITKQAKKKIRKINRMLFFKYRGKAQTTLTLSLTNKYQTIILNVGDSTIYTYNDDLKLLTYIKFYLNNKPYEKIRSNFFGYLVGASIGDYPLFKIHTNILENDGQRLILSSDGVTDLISEERFTQYFKNKTNAKAIVNDALNSPDIIYKSEDNISAITVDLPKAPKMKTKL